MSVVVEVSSSMVGLETPASAPPVEIGPPDVADLARGNTGLPYVWTWKADAPGPHVAVNAVVHGNELCGAWAVRKLFDAGVRPRAGALSLALANVEAFGAFDRRQPFNSRYLDEDFNRVWSSDRLDGPDSSRELERARALRPFYDTVDLLIDLHSMQDEAPPLMLAGTRDKSLRLAAAVGAPQTIVRDPGHRAGVRLRDYAAFDDPDSPRTALLAECGQHWRPSSVDVALEVAVRFLVQAGTIAADQSASILGAAQEPEPQRVIEVTDAVTIQSADFAFVREFSGLDVVEAAGTEIARESGRVIRTPYDQCVLIMPSRRVQPGQTAVRLGRYVSSGVS